MNKIKERTIFFGNETDIKILSNYLNSILGINTYIDYCFRKNILKISENEYSNKVLTTGSLIVRSKNLDVKLVDYIGKIRDVEDFYFCKLNIRSNASMQMAKNEIDTLIKNLSNILKIDLYYTTNCIFKSFDLYIKIDNLIDFSLDDEKLYKAVNKLKNDLKYVFIESCSFKANKDMIETEYFTFPIPSKQEQLLASYFNKSVLNKDLFSPKSFASIGPRENPTAKSKYKTDYLGSRFLKKENKLLNYFKINYKEEYDNSDFSLDDEIKISTNIKHLSDMEIVVISNVELFRKATNQKLCDLPTVYDKLFKSDDYSNCSHYFTIKDYYKIINFNLLLHYTDASKYYEIFEVPVDFNFDEPNSIINSSFISNDYFGYYDVSEVIEMLVNNEK